MAIEAASEAVKEDQRRWRAQGELVVVAIVPVLVADGTPVRVLTQTFSDDLALELLSPAPRSSCVPRPPTRAPPLSSQHAGPTGSFLLSVW